MIHKVRKNQFNNFGARTSVLQWDLAESLEDMQCHAPRYKVVN